MKTTIITFALLVATILGANANSLTNGSNFAHKKSTRVNAEKSDANHVKTHGPKSKKANNTVRDDVMFNRF